MKDLRMTEVTVSAITFFSFLSSKCVKVLFLLSVVPEEQLISVQVQVDNITVSHCATTINIECTKSYKTRLGVTNLK